MADRKWYSDGYGGPSSFAMFLMTVGTILAIVAVVGLIVDFPWKKTPADQYALSYGGGPFEGAQYQKTVMPGSGLVFNGWLDDWYEYPASQRNYIVSSSAEEGDRANDDAIVASTIDKVDTRVELTVTFKLNGSKIREFHENIGLKYEAWTPEGWDRMLNDNLRQPLENTVQQVIRQFDVDKIASDTEILVQVQDAVEETLKREVNGLLGDTYFCGPEYEVGSEDCPNFAVVVKRVDPPEEVKAAFKAQEVSAAEVVSATNRAEAKKAEAEGERAQQEVLTQSLTPAYLEFLHIEALKECAGNANCVLVAGGADSSNVLINPSSGE